MILHFPNPDTLRLALTSGIVPEAVGLAPVAAGFGDEGEIWLQPSKSLASAAVKELKRLGVASQRFARGLPVALDQQLGCWHQLLPLARATSALDEAGKAPVLFELFRDQQLPSLVGEILRLGNDRQSFCCLTNGSEARAMLRVIAPPYYSLLRAVERDGRQTAPRAYVEQIPRVWVEIGYRHELADRIKPPPGKLLLLRPPREWILVEEPPLRDIYELLDFQLPDRPADWQPSELKQRITVPLRLAAGGGEAAELWVLRDGGADEVEQLVRNSDDRLLSRLAFAVGELNGQSTIVLKVRPSKQPPPVLVLSGVAFRSYLKIPHLFLPVGRRLHPPLRRDAVAKLLGEDNNRITWLYPDGDDRFVPESLPDAAFRPLGDWIDYVLDREHEALSAWVAAHRFEFESFICSDDRPAKTKPAPRPRADKDLPEQSKSGTSTTPQGKKSDRSTKEEAGAESDTAQFVGGRAKPKPSELQRRLLHLQQQFRDDESPLDSAGRQQLWQQMALVHTSLKHRHEATVCWSSALWEQSPPPQKAVAAWLQCERHGAPKIKFSGGQLDGLANDNAAQPADASVYAAYLVSAAQHESAPEPLTRRLPILSQYLERQESFLPVRTAWLAWVALTKMAGGDVLALARARDRLLERLFHHGLKPELDMPGFLRTSAGADSESFRVLREHVARLRQLVGNWVVEPVMGDNPQTKAYSDLIFAFALARLGEASECHKLLEQAQTVLKKDDVHIWLRDAYGQRIRQALDGKANQGRLGEELLDLLEVMDRLGRYKVDRLRSCSRILEPTERIDPYRRWHQRYPDDLSRELAELFDVNDRNELKSRLTPLTARLRSVASGAGDHARILDTALELSPRLGESFADEMLLHVAPVLQRTDDVVGRAVLLEKGLLVAGHFDKGDYVQSLVVHFEEVLPKIVASYLTLNIQHNPENKEKIDTIDSLFSQSFRGMRKLGMRDQIGRLFGRLSELLEAQRAKSGQRGAKTAVDPVRAHKLALSVAGGWFYFGQQEPAQKIVAQVRLALASGELQPIDQRTLACAYIHAVGQAPLEWALPQIEDLFSIKKGKRQLARIEDNMTTSSHYSISQLDVIETLVLTLVSDDFTLNAESRRWLDEDEFLVRRRIHRDVREALG